MKGYKVVKVGPKGGLKSCIVEGKALVRYRRNRFNTAPKWLVKMGNYLTFFTSLRSAKIFKLYTEDEQIWSVQVLDVFKPSSEQKFGYNDLKYGKIIFKSSGTWPKGTKMAKKVRLIKRVC